MAVVPGSAVVASGLPFMLEGKPGLLLEHERHSTDQVPSFDISYATRIENASGHSLPDGPVVVQGTWDGDGLVVQQWEAIAPSPRRSDPAPRAAASAPVIPELVQRVVDHLRFAGQVVTWTTVFVSEGAVATVCVYDLHTAEAAIAHLPAAPVRLVASRWTRTQLRAARNLGRSVPLELLLSFGENTTPDVQALITLTIKYMSPDFERLLRSTPGPISVETLITAR